MQETKNENPIVAEAVIVGADSRNLIVYLAKFITLLSVAIFAPAIGIQAVTGTLVNAVLFIATVSLGAPAAILIGFIPSAISAATGALAPALSAMVPFIIISNALLVMVFAAFGKKSYWRGAVFASFFKFAFLSLISSSVIGYFVTPGAASKLAVMMSYPQLYTALSGAMLSYIVLGTVNRKER